MWINYKPTECDAMVNALDDNVVNMKLINKMQTETRTIKIVIIKKPSTLGLHNERAHICSFPGHSPEKN